MRAGSFGAVLRSFAFLNYRKSRRTYLLGTPLLLAWCVMTRLLVHPRGASLSYTFEGDFLTWMFVFGWIAFGTQILFASATPYPVATPDSPIEATYPRNYRALPVTTGTLVLTPLICGLAVPLGLWALFCLMDVLPLHLRFILIGPGAAFPVFTPALGLIAFGTCGQASRWLLTSSPSGAFAMLLSFSMMPIGVFAWLNHTPIQFIDTYFLGVGLWGLWTTLTKAGKVRSGELTFKQKDAKTDTATAKKQGWATRLLPPAEGLTTPLRSQIWISDRNGGGLGCSIFAMIVVVIALVRIAFASNEIDRSLGVGHIKVGAATLQTFFFLTGILAFCSMLGPMFIAVLMMPKGKGQSFVLRQWYSIRPIPSAQIAVASQWQAAKMLLRTCVAIAVGLCIWLLLPGEENGKGGSIGLLLLSHVTFRGVLLSVLIVAFCLVVTWGLMLGTPVDYPWRGKLARLLPSFPISIFLLVGVCGAIFPIAMKGTDPQSGPVDYDFFANALPVVGVWYAIRVVLILVGIRKLRGDDLMQPRTLIIGGAAWAAAVLLFGGGFVVLLPGALPPAMIFVLVVTLLPLNRLFWPTLTIDAARHT